MKNLFIQRLLGGLWLAFFLSGCATTPIIDVDYMGETCPATNHVDVYFSPKDIQKPYRSMGRMNIDAEDFTGPEALDQAVRTQAALRGADAVLVTDFRRQPLGRTIIYDDFGDFYPYRQGTGIAEACAVEEKQVTILLLKYQGPQMPKPAPVPDQKIQKALPAD